MREQRRAFNIVALSVLTVVCALTALLTVDWNGCETELGGAALALLALTTVLGIFSIHGLVTRWDRIESASQAVSIALMSLAAAVMALTVLGPGLTSSGCS